MNTKIFETVLYEEAKSAFQAIINDHGNDLYVLGIYHFGGWGGIMPMFNTRSALRDTQAQDHTPYFDDKKCFDLTVKWYPSDFIDFEDYSHYFSESDNELQALEPDDLTMDLEEISSCWDDTLRAMERVLIRLKKENFFATMLGKNESPALYLATTDEDNKDRLESFSRINSEKIINHYKADFEYLIETHESWERGAFEEAINQRFE
ncbi:hypothetical protein NBRC116494_21470 [Aurantivibrio plasticivorans]